MTELRRWRLYVDARLEVVVEAQYGVDAELLVIDALRDRDAPPAPLDGLDWSEAYVVPGSAVDVGPATKEPFFDEGDFDQANVG